MSTFVRFPRTPHLAWLGEDAPRDDKVLSPSEARSLLAGDVVVEEKLDGANLGISLGPEGALRFQNRGQYLVPPFVGQFQRLRSWISQHELVLREVLGKDQILFGEWCAARHSVEYDRLPDWFVVFDVYDRVAGRFVNTTLRDALSSRAGLSVIPKLFSGHSTLTALKMLVTTASSHFRSGSVEGLVIRKQSAMWLESRAKLVRADFVQNIGEHWRRRVIQWNCLQATPSAASKERAKT